MGKPCWSDAWREVPPRAGLRPGFAGDSEPLNPAATAGEFRRGLRSGAAVWRSQVTAQWHADMWQRVWLAVTSHVYEP